VGGWVGEHFGLRAAILMSGVGALLLAPVMTWLSPLAAMRELPGPQEPAGEPVLESVAEELSS
jgi:predicted MFS family arabinose efflux permease